MTDEPLNSHDDVELRRAALDDALRHALVNCQRRYKISANQAFERLTKIPPSLFLTLAPISNQQMQDLVDSDAKAMLLRTHKNQWDEIESAEWSKLSKKEKRSAKKLIGFLGKRQSFPRQRPSKINYRLVLYLMFTLEELLGRKIPFSRLRGEGPARGPVCEAFLAALRLAQWRISLAVGKPSEAGVSPSALESIIKLMRTKTFDDLMNFHKLNRSPEAAISNSDTLTLVIGLARKRMDVPAGKKRKQAKPK